jgi:hypothetical protein
MRSLVGSPSPRKYFPSNWTRLGDSTRAKGEPEMTSLAVCAFGPISVKYDIGDSRCKWLMEVATIDSHDSSRRIGPIGTASRVVVALGLLLLAGWDGGLSWQIEWYDPLVGLVALLAITVSAGLLAGRYSAGPIRLTGPLAICINCLVIVALVANPNTAGGALLFYGVTLLVAAWRGQPGCEATVLSNLILRRDDQIGCPTFSPIDAAEARRASRSADRGPAITATGAWRRGR